MVEKGCGVFVRRFQVRRVACGGEETQAGARDGAGDGARDGGELRVALPCEDQGRWTKVDEIVPERGLRSRAEMTQDGGEALHAVLAPALAQLRGERFRKV